MNSPSEQQAIDEVFRVVDREIWIVTAQSESGRGGLVATWVSRVSLDLAAPMVLAAIAPSHFTADLIDASGAFALHLVTSEQIGVVWRFGLESGRTTDKLAGLNHRFEATGSPILADCLAWLDCKVIARHEAGDRIFFWADVVAGRRQRAGEPLGERELLGSADAENRDALRENLQADLKALAPRLAKWRAAQ